MNLPNVSLRRPHNVHIALSVLAILVAAAIFFRGDIQEQLYRESSSVINLDVQGCSNPPLERDGVLWTTRDRVPDAVFGTMVEGTLRTNGRGGALFTSADDTFVLSYQAPLDNGLAAVESCYAPG